MNNTKHRQLHYDDVALVPAFSPLASRKEADTKVELGGMNFKLPVTPANMKCTIDEKLAHWLSENEYFYVMHRFDIDILEFVEKANKENWRCISISVGVKPSDHELIKELGIRGLRVDFITVDIAHGHSYLMREMLACIVSHLSEAYIIAGNVCTPEGFDDLYEWGADAIKVGVGPGAACTTKLKTGFTYPMFSCVERIDTFAHKRDHAKLIADGGIKYNGDIAKAIRAGADFIMCGKLFSECLDSPAPVSNNGSKIYFGSASIFNKQHSDNIEGRQIEVECTGMTYKQKLNEIQQDLQSAISYAGGTLKHLWSVDYILI
ncbi:MAG: GMP reductase [Proteobacteria bacterium]|nr:GMP reductase [Pseudomonadota bacterium]